MPISPINFTSPGYDYGAELSEIQRRQALAEGLRQQSQEPINPAQSAGGWAIPISPWQGLHKIGQGAMSGIHSAQAQQQQKELAAKSQSDYQQMLSKGLRQMQGAPGTPMSEDASGNVTAAQPATAPDPMGAMGTFASHPMGSQMMPLAMQSYQRQQLMNSIPGQGQQPQGNPMAPGAGASIMAGSGQVPAQSAPPGPQGAKVGGPAGGIPMDWWMQIDSTGKLYSEQLAKDYAETQKPVVNRGFGIGRMGPAGYEPDPASLTQALDVKRGEAGITAAFGVHNVQGAGGGTTPTFGYQLPGFGGLPNTGGQQQKQPLPLLTVPTDKEAQAVAGAAGKSGKGVDVSVDPWQSMPKRVEPQGVGESTYHRETAVRAAESAHKLAEKYGAVAQTANERKSFNDQALEMLPHATTGTGALAITGVQNALHSRFGISLDTLAKASAGDAAATQELNKNLLNAATKTAKANYGSRMTQSEVMMQIKQGSPNVDMTRAAIQYLLKADNQRADYEIRQGSDLGKYLSSGGDPYQFEGWYSRSFPMSNAVRSGSGANLSPATLEFMRANGITPP